MQILASRCIIQNMQNIILVTLVLGLGFFLYLIGSGEIDPNLFSIKRFQGDVRFEVSKESSNSLKNSATLSLNIKGTPYTVYNFSDMDFKHIPKSEYYMKIYNIPLEAKDAVAGIWLGSRYVFYVTEEQFGESSIDKIYNIYKTEYLTDSTEDVEYIKFKSIKNLDGINNKLEVRY